MPLYCDWRQCTVTSLSRVSVYCDTFAWCQCTVTGVSGVSDRLVGLVVRRPPRERKVPSSNPACAGIFSESSPTSDLKIGAPVATLPGAWCFGSALGLVGPVSVYCDWVK